MPAAEKPVAVFCGDTTNRIYAARQWRAKQRIGERGGFVQVIG